MQAIGEIVKKFDETGVVTNIERFVHHSFARSFVRYRYCIVSFSEIRAVLRQIMAFFVFRSSPTSI